MLPRLARAATFAGDYATAAEALEGLEPDGSADDAALLLARGNLAYFTGDLVAAEAAADEARRRLAFADLGDWRLYDLITLQGLIAHLRGEWFSRLAVELRAGAERPDMARAMFDSHLCVGEYLLYGPTPYEEVLALAAKLRDSARRSGVLRAVAFATALRGEAALLSGDLTLADTELTEAAELHHDIGSTAGEAHSLQRLAEVRLAQGDPRRSSAAASPGAAARPLVGNRSASAATRVRDHDPRRAGRRNSPCGRGPGHVHCRSGRRVSLLFDHARRASRDRLR